MCVFKYCSASSNQTAVAIPKEKRGELKQGALNWKDSVCVSYEREKESIASIRLSIVLILTI